MKKLSDVLEALNQKYAGPIEEMDGFSYIPWHVSTKLANEIFGPLGWDSVVKSCEYVECEVPVNVGSREQPRYEPRNFKGFKSIVTVRVRVWDEEYGVVTTEHDGVGFGEIRGMGNKNPMDGASKSAKSDGISTAIKHFGDAFGLFLYEKENKQATSGTPSNGSSSNGPTGNPPSEKQVAILRNTYSFTPEQIAKMPFSLWKAILDEHFKNKPSRDAMYAKYEAKLTEVGIVRKTDNLPIPQKSVA